MPITSVDNTLGEKKEQSCKSKYPSELEALPEWFLGHCKYLKHSN